MARKWYVHIKVSRVAGKTNQSVYTKKNQQTKYTMLYTNDGNVFVFAAPVDSLVDADVQCALQQLPGA